MDGGVGRFLRNHMPPIHEADPPKRERAARRLRVRGCLAVTLPTDVLLLAGVVSAAPPLMRPFS